ncbi:MAG: fibronectin type III domain-containing protein [Patescibacteria group bacterium]|nr:fibronectin type III domain-containing protein [Patescibacteria group bacterium]
MKKNILVIFLTIVLGLIFFNADFCLALNDPENLNVESIDEAKATLGWDWSENGGTLKQFKFLYKATNSTIWTARYPVAGSGTITYDLMGLLEGTIYQWRILAQAENPANDSSLIDGPPFETTIDSPPPPEAPEENGDDWLSLQNMELRNPLSQDSFEDALDAALNSLTLASFAIAPILIIYAAFLMIFAAGDATKIKRGKDIIFWTIIALGIILFAKGLPSIIKAVFISQ